METVNLTQPVVIDETPLQPLVSEISGRGKSDPKKSWKSVKEASNMAETTWKDITTSAFNGDYSAYIRYANQSFWNISGMATAESTNGMRIFNISGEYTL